MVEVEFMVDLSCWWLHKIAEFHACTTGDCPHNTTQECAEVMTTEWQASRTSSRPFSAMVLVYMPELGHSVWQDYGGMQDKEAGYDVPISEAEALADLRAGVKDGRWVGWRVITKHAEVIGDEPVDLKEQS